MEEVKETVTESISMEDLSSEELDFDELQPGQLREGVVLAASDDGLLVDIGGKLDGFVPIADLKGLSEEQTAELTSEGQTLQVLVTKTRDRNGNVELSVSQALGMADWIEAERLKESEEVYEAAITTSNRGGLLIEFGQLQGFVPMSQLIGFSRIRSADKRYLRLHAMVGKPIMLKVIEVNRERNRLIFSQRAAAKEWRTKRRGRLLGELEPGQIRTGRLSQITEFGLFVNLGGIDGLVHVSELSWGRIENPAEIYTVGQKVKVQVLNVDVERQRIGLSIKALLDDPWDSVIERYSEGDLAKGVISQVGDFGIFVELEPGIEGLLHNTELVSTDQREELAAGKEILVKIIRIESQRRRIGLSVKQVQLHEWEEWHTGEAE